MVRVFTKKDKFLFNNVNFFSKIFFKSFLLSLLCFFFICILLIIIYYGDLYLNVKSGNYKSPIFNSYVIVSPSMVPTINVNDAIIIKRQNNNNYSVGDIVSFFSTEYNSKGMIVTHRIVNKNISDNSNLFYITKGDNNSIPDKNSLYSDNIYGKVFFIVPKLGVIKYFLSKPINFVLCILIPTLIIIIFDFMRVHFLFKKNNV